MEKQTYNNYKTNDYIYYYEKELDGYRAEVRSKWKKKYEPLLSEINGKPLVSLWFTFSQCFKLTEAPVIPNTVKYMTYTFNNCYSLTEAPEIPESVVEMHCTFSRCIFLKKAPIIPNSVTEMFGTFMCCKSLETAPIIPKDVIEITCLFYGCSSLTGNIEINANPKRYKNCFVGVDISNLTLTGSSQMLDLIKTTYLLS